MITLREWMELVNYRITEGSAFQWKCYGLNAHCLDSFSGEFNEGGYDCTVVFDTKDQTVFEVAIFDYGSNKAYRMIHPDYVETYMAEAMARGVSTDLACDDIKYTDVSYSMDFLREAKAIMSGKKSWVIEVIEHDVTGELVLPFPEDLLATQGWEPGDTLVWTDNKDGTWSITKKA